MKLRIQNKINLLAGGSKVLDENGELVYAVKGKIISPTRKKKIYDKDGNLLYIVRNKYWRFLTRKCIIYDGNKKKIAKIKDKPFSFKGLFFVENYKEEIKFEGAFLDPMMAIYANDKVVGTLTRNIKLFGDAFELDALDEYAPFLTALVIGIDNIQDSYSNNKLD